MSSEPQFVSIGGIEVFVANEHPAIWSAYCGHAELIDDQSDATGDETALFVAGVRRADREWPALVVALKYSPSRGFAPGILLAPETNVVFVGAGKTLRAYRIDSSAQVLWRDEAEMGFWRWRQHGSTVLMSAELELTAWDIDGTKLWSRFVEPPWSYSVEDHYVAVNVMGSVTTFDLRTGS